MNSIFARCLGWIVMAAALASPALAGEPVSLEPGMDRMGADYKSFPVRQADPGVCRQACANDAACKAYTFVKPGIKGPAAVCFLKSGAGQAGPNACCTSGLKTAAVQGGRPPPLVPPVVQLPPIVAAPTSPGQQIMPPSEVKVSADDPVEISWLWGALGCFPNGAGQVPAACQFIKDIDGFKIYSAAGKLLKTAPGATIKSAQLGKGQGSCFVVRAYKGLLESASSEQGCTGSAPKTKYQSTDAIAVPAGLHVASGVPECAAATGGGLMQVICDASIKANAQPLLWKWSGKPNEIDGFRLYDSNGTLPIEVSTKANPALRVFMIEPGKGTVVTSYCFSVRAYKGMQESKPSNQVCLTPLAEVPPPPPPPPTDLRVTRNGALCAAAGGGSFMAPFCDAVIKENGQILIFDWSGGAKNDVDGFRLYDSSDGVALLRQVKDNGSARLFVIPALNGVKVSDWCFTVRSFEDERESKPSNTVCVPPLPKIIPPPPPPDILVLAPAKGNGVSDVRSEKNFNNGCPWATKLFSYRSKGDVVDSMTVGYIHKDKNILCGKRLRIWQEGDVEFALGAVPGKFTKATLKFTSAGTLAIENTKPGLLDSFGNPKTLNAVNCVRDVFSYEVAVHDQPGGTQHEYGGDTWAYYSYWGKKTLATSTNTAVDGANVIDVTDLLRQRLKAKKKTLGIGFGVDQAMYANQDMCMATLHSFTLEIESKK